ncbi:MAG: hypothetical protein AAGM21_01790 [Pseudomonadota bacterium]
MKLKGLLMVAEADKNEFDGTRRRGLLPFFEGNNKAARYGGIGEYTLDAALRFRIMTDLTRSGLQSKSAMQFVVSGLGRIGSGERHFAPPRNYLATYDDQAQPPPELFIAREIYLADWISLRGGFENDRVSVRYWAGTLEEITRAVAFEDEEGEADNRESVSLQYYSVTRALARVREIASDLGLPDTHQNTPDFVAESKAQSGLEET